MLLGAPVDGVVVLGVDEHQSAVVPGGRHQADGLGISERQTRCGEVLERSHPALDHLRQLPQHPIVDAPDDDVEGVVHEGATRVAVIIVHHFGKAGGVHLICEADDGGGAATRGGAGRGLERIGVLPEALRLLDVTVAVDTSRQDQPPAGVYRPPATAQSTAQSDDTPAGDPDIAGLEPVPRCDPTSRDDQVEFRHLPPPLSAAARAGAPTAP